MKHYFVLPDNRDLPSGGNLYNQQLIEALQNLGIELAILDFKAFKVHYQQQLNGNYWIDTLFMAELHFLQKSTDSKRQYFLITHFLESLYPSNGQSADTLFQQEYTVLQHFNGFLVPSPFMAEYLQNRGLYAPCFVLPPAFSPPSPLKGEPIIQDIPPLRELGGRKALIVANLIECKGVLPFLQTLVKTTCTNYHITIIGRTDIEADYAQMCFDLVANHLILQHTITILGTVPHKTVIEQYAKHELFISTSFMETYGMALQEANAFHLPILALNRGNVPFHISEGKNGRLFNTSADLAKGFVEWVEFPLVFEHFQKQVLQYTQKNNYDWTRAAQRFISFLQIEYV